MHAAKPEYGLAMFFETIINNQECSLCQRQTAFPSRVGGHGTYSPSHRRGTLKGVATVKSPKSHFNVTLSHFLSHCLSHCLSHLKVTFLLEPLLAYPYLWDRDVYLGPPNNDNNSHNSNSNHHNTIILY